MVQTTRAQRVKLKELWEQDESKGKGSYREFRKSVTPGFGYIGIMWNGMYIGIETDGYTHS